MGLFSAGDTMLDSTATRETAPHWLLIKPPIRSKIGANLGNGAAQLWPA